MCNYEPDCKAQASRCHGSPNREKYDHEVHKLCANQLRHAAATAIRKQFGIEAAQVALGHAAADVTQIYAEKNLSLAAEVMAKSGGVT